MNSSNSRVPVSVLVPIRNEAENLPRCLSSVQWADEIFVVDSKSTDGSIEIAQRHGAKVVQFEFNGVWPKKKNWALDIFRSRTSGFSSSMLTKSCRRRLKRNSHARLRTLVRL